MMHMRGFTKAWLLCLTTLGCNGCSRAPSIEVIGSFFPAWMFCIIGALVLTGLTRVALLRRGLEAKLGPLVLFYPCLAVATTCLLWLILFS